MKLKFGCCKQMAGIKFDVGNKRTMNNSKDHTNNYLHNECQIDQVDRGWQDIVLVKYRSCLIVLTGIICFALYAFSHGNPLRLLHPTNSQGELCGQHNQTSKPNLLYFDLTQCAGISQEEVCHTTRVCVTECPQTYWTSDQGKALGLEKFCKNESDLNTTTMANLVHKRLCPPYLLPTKPVLGRCVPMVGFIKREEGDKTELKINGLNNAEGEIIKMDSLMEGIVYVMDGIDARRHLEKTLSPILESWWIIIVSIFLAIMISLLWIFLLNIVPRIILWTNTAILIILLVAGTVFYFMTYNNTDDIIFLNTIARLTSLKINKIGLLVFGTFLSTFGLISTFISINYISSIKAVINYLSEASKTTLSRKNNVFYPTIQSLLMLLLISFSLAVSMSLATTGSPEHRVVDSCSSETCHNNYTGRMFSHNDICDKKTFPDCTGCPKAQCVFHKYGQNTVATWLQLFNLAGMVFMVFFAKRCRGSVVTEAVDSTQDRNWMSSIRRLFKRNFSYTIFQRNVRGDNICMVGYKYFQKPLINIDKTTLFIRLTALVIFSGKCCITGFVVIVGFVIFSLRVYNQLYWHLNYHFGFILINILVVYISISPLFNICIRGDSFVDLENRIELETVNAVEAHTISFDVQKKTGKGVEANLF